MRVASTRSVGPAASRPAPLLRYGLVAVAILVLVAAWLAFRAVTVARDLGTARSDLALVSAQLQAGRLSALADPAVRDRVESIGELTAAARAATSDPVWRAAATVPVLGNNFRTVAALAQSSDLLGRSALPSVTDALDGLAAAQSAQPGARLAALRRAAAGVRTAMSDLGAARADAAASPATFLLPPVASARAELGDRLAAAERQLTPPADAMAILPALLGADGPRTYFVAFTNPAELRGSSGLVGAYALLRADQGDVSVPTLGANSTLPDLPVGPAGMPPDWEDRYLRYGALTDWNQSNLSPDFASTGLLWSLMYATATRTTVDGVLQLDPQALSVLLAATGPVQVAGRSITSGNVADFLLRQQYALPLTSDQREGLLDEIGRAAVTRLLAGPGLADPDLLAGLARAADGGHVRFWSQDAPEQAVVARYPIGGVLPDTAQPFGMAVVNNSAGSKLDTYLDSSLEYRVDRCTVSQRSATVTVRLRNGAPASGLPPYVTLRADAGDGSDDFPVPQVGSNRSWLSVFLTRGATLRSATVDGAPVGTTPGPGGSYYAPWLQVGRERGHPVVSTFLDTRVGQTVTLVLQVDEPPSTSPPLLLAQPTVRPQVLRAAGSCSG